MKFPFSQEYKTYAAAWTQIRASVKGKIGIAMLLQGDSINPFSLISPTDYDVKNQQNLGIDTSSRQRMIYFSRGRFTNFTGSTHKAFHGMLHEKQIDTDLSLPNEFLNNVDGGESSLDDYISEQTSEGLKTCRTFIVVDYPTLSNPTSEDYMKNPPRFVEYCAEAIRNTVVTSKGLVRIDLTEHREEFDSDKDEYKTVFYVVRFDIEPDGKCYKKEYRLKSADANTGDMVGEKVPIIVRGEHLSYIPGQFFGSEDNTASFNMPILFDIAHQNLGHFNLDCDNRTSIHYTSNPVMNTYEEDPQRNDEANPSGINVNPNGRNRFGKDDRAEYLQASPENRASSEMEKDEKRMINLGAQVVKDSGQAQTLGAEKIQNNSSMAPLKRFSINYSQGFTWLCNQVAKYYGTPQDNTISINTKFSTDSMTFQDLQTIFAIHQGGGATIDEVHEVKRKVGMTDKTNEELNQLLDEEGPRGDSEEVAALKMELDNLKAQMSGGE
jgi:hypothetical protein